MSSLLLNSNKSVWDKNVKPEVSGYFWSDDPIIFESDSKNTNSPNVIELFSGCGGTSKGFEMAGYNIAVGTDIHKPSFDTFKLNHPNSNVILSDIKKLNPNIVKDLIGDKKVDVMIAGVPCQGFSHNNRKKNINDERNKLYLEFAKFVKILQPKVIVLENVSGMASTGTFRNDIESHLSTVSGTKVSSSFVYAPDFGVPQIRKRLVFIGIKNVHSFSFDEIIKTHGLDFKSPYNTIKDAIGDLPSLKTNEQKTNYEMPPKSEYQNLMRASVIGNKLTNHKAPNHITSVINNIKNTQPGAPMYSKYKQRIRLNWDELSPTQVAGGIRPQFQFGHPLDIRGLTVRERCRIQSFPDDFHICGGIVQGRVQTGNAVPPLLSKAIALAIKKYI